MKKLFLFISICFIFTGVCLASSATFITHITTTPITIYSGTAIIESGYCWNYSTYTVTFAVQDSSNRYVYLRTLTTLTEGSAFGAQISGTGFKICVSSIISTNDNTQDNGFNQQNKNKIGGYIIYQK